MYEKQKQMKLQLAFKIVTNLADKTRAHRSS